jgi:hypothetical protein
MPSLFLLLFPSSLARTYAGSVANSAAVQRDEAEAGGRAVLDFKGCNFEGEIVL